MATQPSLRIGDTERDSVAAELREHFAHGRLSLEEFNQRLDAVFAAKTQSELARITRDLPHVRPSSAPLPSARTSSTNLLTSGPSAGAWPGHGAVATHWAGPVSAGGEWARGDWTGGRRSRHGIGAFATLLAVLATWLLVYDVILVGLRWPLPGRLGLLLAIFAVIRGLVRKIFRGVGGRRARYSGRPW